MSKTDKYMEGREGRALAYSGMLESEDTCEVGDGRLENQNFPSFPEKTGLGKDA